MWGFHKAVCPLLITHSNVGVSQSSLPSADYPQYCGGFTRQFHKAGLPLLITHDTVGVYPQYCGGFTKQFALC